jgi:Predicted endonuclease involved in recombination (possible Holliday junction resolvase in Mycoplasmas and B. subtilis)
MRYLGIDYGSRRVGLALSDDEGRMAFPHSVVPNTPHLVADVQAVVEREQVERIVMGKSLDTEGNPNPIMEEITPFGAALERHLGRSVIYEPEFYTSVQAMKLQGRNDMIDASAASIILQSYLDRQRERPRDDT